MRQYHRLYKRVPETRRCWCPAPGVVPTVIAAQKPVSPLVCLWALASAPWKMLLFSCKKREAEASTDAGLVCVPRIALVPSQSHTNTNSVSNNGKIMGMYCTETLLHPRHLAACLGITDALDTKHLAGLAPVLPMMPQSCHHHHHDYFTGDVLPKHEEQLHSQADGWGAQTELGILSPVKGRGKPSPLQIKSAGTKQNLMESSAPWGKAFLLSLCRKRESWGQNTGQGVCCIWLSLGWPIIGKSTQFTQRQGFSTSVDKSDGQHWVSHPAAPLAPCAGLARKAFGFLAHGPSSGPLGRISQGNRHILGGGIFRKRLLCILCATQEVWCLA